MNTTLLSAASGLNPGSDLWAVADRPHSKWNLQLDWLCNFKLLAFERHKASKKSVTLQNMINDTELKLGPIARPLPESPLLLSSCQWLPNRWILFIPYTDTQKWISHIGSTWMGLQQPSLRIFLPTHLSANDFSQTWQSTSLPSADITLVNELSLP